MFSKRKKMQREEIATVERDGTLDLTLSVIGVPPVRIEKVTSIIKVGDYVVIKAKFGGAVISADKFISVTA